ncbi:hypothetical protein RX830_12255, partial [Pseudomonas syringae pv. actinidiae]|nr:hypothetical protein [Pseudomonas syringae pv. actinidiae]MDU8282612.1 hypothetical protein [Pseudomonas syringae pv. actinidiae]MDU8303496.1 hypothetical protein [Pseudomonas syringae pv. actinidiae]
GAKYPTTDNKRCAPTTFCRVFTHSGSAVAYMLTAFYMVLQILLLIPKYRQMLRDWRVKS